MDARTASTSCSSRRLDQIELADRLGYDYAWEVEHHFLEEYSPLARRPRCSSPRPASAPSSIRLGHGIIQLTDQPPGPRRRAGVARSTCCQHGRVELGLGEAATTTELHPFDRRFRDKREVWEDAVRVPACRCSASDGWEYHGEYFDFPLRNVIPKPRQKPHPPLWVACSQLETIAMAGRRGMGALGFQFVSAEAAQAWVHAYYNAFTKRPRAARATTPTNPNIAVVSQFMCAPTDEEARARADGSTFFQFALALLQQPRARSCPGDGQPVGRVPGVAARRRRARSSAARRPDRLAGHDPRASCASSRSRTSTR